MVRLLDLMSAISLGLKWVHTMEIGLGDKKVPLMELRKSRETRWDLV